MADKADSIYLVSCLAMRLHDVLAAAFVFVVWLMRQGADFIGGGRSQSSHGT